MKNVGVLRPLKRAVKKSAVEKRATPRVVFSNKELQPIRTNYNVLPVNCEQDWKVSGHCSISLVSSRNNLHRTIMIVCHIVYSRQ